MCSPHPQAVATVPWEIHKVIFNNIIHTYFWLFTLSGIKWTVTVTIITVYLLSLGQYYRVVLLTQDLLPAICSIAGDVLQDNEPAHRACDIVELLRCETHQLVSYDMCPAISSNLNQVDYHI